MAEKMELLAPAGTVEAFEAAVSHGADAVYIGAPSFNAREPAKNFSYPEVAAMIDHAHRAGVKLYLAMNSLVKDSEIDQAVRSLVIMEALGPDALIVQDLGLIRIIRRYFPGLRLHASTLTAAHNSMAVNYFASLGCARVVLPRELELAEIREISRKTEVELEVFVHGAMCFSYSGLCLFSSFLGGKSGLRGRCVQPCRRRYAWQGKTRGGGGYLFSMNDLEGVDYLAELAEAGVGSIKIEGRLRSASYVARVVEAHRLVLDAGPAEQEAALGEARKLLAAAMGRRTSGGYFKGRRPDDLISAHHSGNIGSYLGKVKSLRRQKVILELKGPMVPGDRLRVHHEKTGERSSFVLKEIRRGGGRVERAGRGETVEIFPTGGAAAGDSLYRVDLAGRGQKTGKGLNPGRFRGLVKEIPAAQRSAKIISSIGMESVARAPARRGTGRAGRRKGRKSLPVDWWVKSDDSRILQQRFPIPPARVVVTLSRESWRGFVRMKRNGPLFKRLIWALPPIIDEEDLDFYWEIIERLAGWGYGDFQIAHISQLAFFGGGSYRISGDYQLNIMNRSGLAHLSEAGIGAALISIETDRANLKDLSGYSGGPHRGLVVYGRPALFTARYTGDPLRYGRPFTSPRGEVFVLKKSWNYTLAVPRRPFSLLGELGELARSGIGYVVVDLSCTRLSGRMINDLTRRLEGGRGAGTLSTFNFIHGLR